MRVQFLSAAACELDEAVQYYDHQLPGLGFRFYREVDAAVERMRTLPDAWTLVRGRTRRCLVKGFPYAILYVVEEDLILVTAVAHLHRDPDHYGPRIW